ncbi:hypothetical protein F5Y13DRAFT_198626 [Hypoxylon sp. FL1857]|nr:hypothetical protein F5Y13DRAFT_198626 [Hypoxylon sp. FL1857]
MVSPNHDTSSNAGQTNNAAFTKVVVLVDKDEVPFLVAVQCFLNLSPQLATHVLTHLPTKKHVPAPGWSMDSVKEEAIVWESMNIDTFRLLGEFQLRRDYDIPFPTQPIHQGGGDSEARQSFAEHAQNINSVIMWSMWLSQQKDSKIDCMVRPFFAEFLEEYGMAIISPNPPDVGTEHLLPHANLYFLARKFGIYGLDELAIRKLMVSLLRAHLTFDFAGAFAKLARYVFDNAKGDDDLKKRICKIRTLVVNLFIKHPEFEALFLEVKEFAEETMYLRVPQ